MSFFDEADEPRRTIRQRRPPSSGGGGHRPPMDHQTLLVRRLVAAGAVVLVIILMVFFVKSCADSRRTAALKDYNRNVRSLVEESKSTVGKPFFQALTGAGARQQKDVQETINQLRVDAEEELNHAERLDVPGSMGTAQDDLELMLSLRRDGVQKVADLIQQALGKSAAAGTAVNQIAGQMQAFNASDVIYSQRVAPLILKGLKDDGISASYDGTAGEQVLPYSDFLPSIGWMDPAYVGTQLGAASSGGSTGTPAPGLHGHQLDSVSVGGTTLTPDGSNRISASPPPTFTVTFTNGGENNETGVVVTVEVTGTGAPIKAQKTVPNTTAGQQTSTDVQLPKSPPTNGAVTIKVTVEKVPGEQSLDNNTKSYPALFG